MLTQNETAIGASDMTNAMNEIAGIIKNGDITSNTSISASKMDITLKIKSTYEHKASNGRTYSIEYVMTLKIHFKEFVDPLPVGVTETQATDYNANLANALQKFENSMNFLNDLHPDLQFAPVAAFEEGTMTGVAIFIVAMLLTA
ncbi:hypothetical protein C5Z26_02135 [Lactobacillus sp. CBA3606]|nr:hypothetical protein C5Z25_00485 [Lactobacillus sp. CBA3605]AVK62994.1 hypothetical protein C5Z26_02135 [Lactobacillus sp. CBA3606]